MEFIRLTDELVPSITELWNRNFAVAYQITEKMLRKKVLLDRDYFPDGTFVCLEEGKPCGLIVSKIADGSLPEYHHAAWISLLCVDKPFRGRGIGTALYQKAESALTLAGVREIIIGGEMRNFVSGIPCPDEASIAFFQKLGFTINDSEHYDLVNDAAAIPFEQIRTREKINFDSSYVTRPYTPDDAEALERFFDGEFPGRWKLEVMGYLKKGGDPAFVLVMVKGKEVKGFCKVFVSEPGKPSFYIGENFGALGPIGIAADCRGSGLGMRILYDSLYYLKQAGARNINIDWTELRYFYGRFGFEPWRTYRGADKQLSGSEK